MRIFAAWTVTVALTLGACGGNVVVDGSGVGAGNAGVGASGAGGAGSGASGMGMGAQGVAGSGNPGCAPTCAAALANGGVPCGGTALTDYQTLQSCAGCSDVGNCEGVCGGTLCDNGPATAACSSCVQSSCAAETFACQNN
jgi:hypothetical protein